MDNYLTNHSHQRNTTDNFDINSLQWLTENREPVNEKNHCNNQYEIIWVTAGNLSHWLNLQRQDTSNNRLFLTLPGQMHSFNLSENTRGYRICFSESFLSMEGQSSDATYYNSLFRLFAGPEGIIIPQELTADLEEIIQRLIKEYGSFNLFRQEILRRYFKIFLIYLARLFEEKFLETKQTRNSELVQKFMCSLEKKYKTQKMVSDYAGELLVSPNYLNEIIKKMTGLSAGHHIRNRIVLEAKRLARYSNSCMKEIAYSLGFSDSAHFSKFFKSVTGMNFSEFKKEKQMMPVA